MRLTLLFLYTLFLALLLSVFVPHQRFAYFVPVIILCMYRYNLSQTLWCALFVGLFLDFLSVETCLGFYGLTYTLTAAYLYRYQYQFFEDSLTTLPIMTCFFVILSTLLQVFLWGLFTQQWILSWQWLQSDLFWSPLKDGFYAFIAFTLPALSLIQLKRYWFLRKRRKR